MARSLNRTEPAVAKDLRPLKRVRTAAAEKRRKDPARVSLYSVISNDGTPPALAGDADERSVVGGDLKIIIVIITIVRLVFGAGVDRVNDNDAISVKDLRLRIARKQSVVE